MSVNIVIPAAGESVTSGVLTRWVKKQGDYVKRDETVLELETDKVNLEVPAPAAGVLSVTIAEGATVTIGQVVGAIDEKAAAPTPISASATPGVGAPAAPAPVAEPKIAEPKPVAAAPAKSAPPAPAKSAPPAPAKPAPASGGQDDDVRATPLARKLADELHVDISRLLGTGPGGRIREQDVLAAAQAHAGTNGSAAKPMLTAPRGVTRERMSPLRQRIAQRLVQAQHTAAMLTTFNECDMTAVMDLRKQYKEEFEKKHTIGLGFMGFFVKAVVSALQAYPLVNASIVDDEQGQPAIEKHAYCDVAVAVSTPKGLTVPVLRDCQDLSVSEIEKGIKELATKARDGKLTLEELQGGTFTITNGGIYGSLMSTPILNPPQSAILGMHAIKNRAVEHPAGSGQVAIRPMMYLAVSYDHRIIDGAQAVQFLVHIKNAIENPTRLLLEI